MNARAILILAAVALGVLAMTQAAKVRQLAERYGARFRNLHPEMQRRYVQVQEDLAARGIRIGMPSTGGWRSLDDQRAISPNATNVKDPRDSYHVWGLAFDAYPLNAAGVMYIPEDADDPLWQEIGAAYKRAGLRWGNDWDGDGVLVSKDPDERLADAPHAELQYLSLAALKAGYSDPMQFISSHHEAAFA